MLRVIGGKFKSRRLATPQGLTTRPTSDRLRETLFDILQPKIKESNFLDCFAGSGAVGIEAMSRGAAFVVLIESLPQSVRVIKVNLSALGIDKSSHYEVLAQPVESALKILGRQKTKFDIVFLDPPYAAEEEYLRVLTGVQKQELLVPGALIVAQHSRFMPLEARHENLVRTRDVRQGDSVLSFFEVRE